MISPSEYYSVVKRFGISKSWERIARIVGADIEGRKSGSEGGTNEDSSRTVEAAVGG
jgi:hypothetical protein